MLERDGEKGNLLHCWWECKLVQPLRRTVWRFHKKMKTEVPYDTAIPLLGIYTEKSIIWKDTCPPNVHCSTINNSQDTEPPKYPSINELIKMWHRYTIAYYSAIKRRNNAIFSNVDGLRGYPTKWNKSGRDKYHMISLTCGI